MHPIIARTFRASATPAMDDSRAKRLSRLSHDMTGRD